MKTQRLPWQHHQLVQLFFYGNYFYGVCAVAQSVEATLQQRYPLNSILYYLLVFTATVLYYNYPYARKHSSPARNSRSAWYIAHYNYLKWNQLIATAIVAAGCVYLLVTYRQLLVAMSPVNWLLLAAFPLVAAFYYGINFLSHRYNLRKIGWLKPFIIGFTWSGLVTVYPLLYTNIINRQTYDPTFFSMLLFIKNGMFVSMLCIMFDIKDYASDHSSRLKTFVVKIGLRKTLFFVIIPLTLLGLLTFITYALTHRFHAMKIILNMIPFALLVLAAYSLRRRRSLMYYLVIIDGLMLAKAFCGITAMLLF